MPYCRLLISFLIMVLGCGRASEPDGWRAGLLPPDGASGGPDGDFTGHQGRLLYALRDVDPGLFKMDNGRHPHVIDAGQLVADGLAGRDLVGFEFGSLDIPMRITEVFSPDQTGGVWQYAIERQDRATGAWSPACAEPAPIVPPAVPPRSPPRAFAMNGIWNSDGLYNVNADAATFACETGAIGKCIGWGYSPTATPPTVTENGQPTKVTGPDMLQACTRMARADYCAAGVPSTLEGTPIKYDDIFHSPRDTSGYFFEAAWRGVAWTGGAPQRPMPICLSKLRWSTLPVGGGCGLPLPDPRSEIKGKFCEDLTPVQLEQMGALVYSWSSVLDAGLYTYSDRLSGNRLTTAHLLPGPVGTPPAWSKIPKPAGVSFPAPGQSARLEATIFSPDLPPGVSASGLVVLSSYRCGNDLMTTTSPPPAGCTKIADEGYVYPPNAAGHTALRRWIDATGHRSITTALAPSSMIASGWRLAEVVGGVLRAEMSVNVRWSALAGAAMSLDIRTQTGEWISPCLDAAQLGTKTQLEYRGNLDCVSAPRTPARNEVALFRVSYTVAGQTQYAFANYDDTASDVYLHLPTGTTTAIAVSWNEVAPGARYALDVRPAGGDWVRCVDSSLLANGTSHVFTGSCPAASTTISPSSIQQLRVCTTSGTSVCGQVDYDGKQPQVAIAL
jgi:hypothetical protein